MTTKEQLEKLMRHVARKRKNEKYTLLPETVFVEGRSHRQGRFKISFPRGDGKFPVVEVSSHMLRKCRGRLYLRTDYYENAIKN